MKTTRLFRYWFAGTTTTISVISLFCLLLGLPHRIACIAPSVLGNTAYEFSQMHVDQKLFSKKHNIFPAFEPRMCCILADGTYRVNSHVDIPCNGGGYAELDYVADFDVKREDLSGQNEFVLISCTIGEGRYVDHLRTPERPQTSSSIAGFGSYTADDAYRPYQKRQTGE